MENETELFKEENAEGSTIMTSKRLILENQRQGDLAKKFFEQMVRGERGIVYNSETGKLEEVK